MGSDKLKWCHHVLTYLTWLVRTFNQAVTVKLMFLAPRPVLSEALGIVYFERRHPYDQWGQVPGQELTVSSAPPSQNGHAAMGCIITRRGEG